MKKLAIDQKNVIFMTIFEEGQIPKYPLFSEL